MSIYSTNDWVGGTSYVLHDIVKYDSSFYYATTPHSSSQTPGLGSSYWGGKIAYLTSSKPHFIFRPSYGHKVNVNGALKLVQFGEGYQQRVPDGINNTLVKIDYAFLLRGNNETAAITHFLEKRCSLGESFIFTPPAPFNTAKLFYCPQFDVENIFFENSTIIAKFEEVPA